MLTRTHASRQAADHSTHPDNDRATPNAGSRSRDRKAVVTPIKRARYSSIGDDASLSMRRDTSACRALYACQRERQRAVKFTDPREQRQLEKERP